MTVLLCYIGTPSHANAISVVVTIKPVHSLTSAVMQGVGSPDLMLSGPTDPHSHSLRPSQARSIENADVLIWLGPVFEQFLHSSVDNLSAETHVLTLLNTDGVSIPRARDADNHGHGHRNDHSDDDQSGAPADSDDAHSDEHQHDHSHEHQATDDTSVDSDLREADEGQTDSFNLDPHIWLNPANAAVMALAIADVLATKDPSNAVTYQRNARKLVDRIEEIDKSIQLRMAPLRNLRYLVAHDAYQSFEQHYGLLPGGVLRVSPAIPTGARRLRELIKSIRERNIDCLISEPWFPQRLLDVLVDNTDVAVSTIDVLGTDFEAGPELWFALIDQVADGFEHCRGNASN